MKLDYDIDFYHVIKQNKRRIEQMTECEIDFFDDFHDDIDGFNEVNLNPYKEKFKIYTKIKDKHSTEQELNRRIKNLQKDISQLNIKIMSEKAKLNNKEFSSNAPKSVVEKTMGKIKEYERLLKSKSNEHLKLIGKLDRVKSL